MAGVTRNALAVCSSDQQRAAFELQYGHTFGRRILWPAVRRDQSHAGVLDAHLFSQVGDFLVCPVEFRFQPDAGDRAIRRPTEIRPGGQEISAAKRLRPL